MESWIREGGSRSSPSRCDACALVSRFPVPRRMMSAKQAARFFSGKEKSSHHYRSRPTCNAEGGCAYQVVPISTGLEEETKPNQMRFESAKARQGLTYTIKLVLRYQRREVCDLCSHLYQKRPGAVYDAIKLARLGTVYAIEQRRKRAIDPVQLLALFSDRIRQRAFRFELGKERLQLARHRALPNWNQCGHGAKLCGYRCKIRTRCVVSFAASSRRKVGWGKRGGGGSSMGICVM